jgi:hypothetical protein
MFHPKTTISSLKNHFLSSHLLHHRIIFSVLNMEALLISRKSLHSELDRHVRLSGGRPEAAWLNSGGRRWSSVLRNKVRCTPPRCRQCNAE